jgi:hypothetical protein
MSVVCPLDVAVILLGDLHEHSPIQLRIFARVCSAFRRHILKHMGKDYGVEFHLQRLLWPYIDLQQLVNDNVCIFGSMLICALFSTPSHRPFKPCDLDIIYSQPVNVVYSCSRRDMQITDLIHDTELVYTRFLGENWSDISGQEFSTLFYTFRGTCPISIDCNFTTPVNFMDETTLTVHQCYYDKLGLRIKNTEAFFQPQIIPMQQMNKNHYNKFLEKSVQYYIITMQPDLKPQYMFKMLRFIPNDCLITLDKDKIIIKKRN